MQITLSKPQEYVLTTTRQINLFLGGVGSGKTFLIGLKSAYFINRFPEVFGFIGANTYMQLTQSTIFRVRSIWEEYFGWREGVHYVSGKKPPKSFNTEWHQFDDYNSIISFKSGAVVFKGSLDNAKAHDGKEFGWAFLDETKDSREEDVKDVILARLRAPGMYISKNHQLTRAKSSMGDDLEAFNPLYIMTSPAKVEWINEWFGLNEDQTDILAMMHDKRRYYRKETKSKCVVICSTFHNEQNLPKGYIQKQIKNRSKEKADMLIYGNPFVKTGGEFYSSFNTIDHVQDVEFNPDLPIHISFDQNVVPYITMTLYQVEYKESGIIEVRQFDEICLENPRNKTTKLCFEFIKRWGAKCKNGLFYYGDPSGRKSDTRSPEHDYDTVERLLRKYLNNRSNRVPYVHPRVLKRKDFINDALEGAYNFRIIIDPKCKKSVADFKNVKEDTNGKKSKKKVTDKTSGISYEPFGHTSDSFDYFFCEIFKPIFDKNYK